MALGSVGLKGFTNTIRSISSEAAENAIRKSGQASVKEIPLQNPNLPPRQLVNQTVENVAQRQLQAPGSGIAPKAPSAWEMGMESLQQAQKADSGLAGIIDELYQNPKGLPLKVLEEQIVSHPRVRHGMNVAARKYVTAGERMLQDATGEAQKTQAKATLEEGAKRFENLMIDPQTGRVIVDFHALAVKTRMGMGDAQAVLELLQHTGGTYRTSLEGAFNLASRVEPGSPLYQNYMEVSRYLLGAVADAQASGGGVVLRRGADGFDLRPVSLERTQELFNAFQNRSSGQTFNDLDFRNLRN